MISIHELHRGLKPKITKIEKLQKRRTTTIPNIFFPIIKWSRVIYSLQSYTISYIGTALTHYVLIFLSFFTWTMIYPYWWSNWSSIIGYASSFSPLLMPQASCRCIPPPSQTKNSSFFFFSLFCPFFFVMQLNGPLVHIYSRPVLNLLNGIQPLLLVILIWDWGSHHFNLVLCRNEWIPVIIERYHTREGFWSSM